jgi:hypothetical protein
MVGPTPLGDRVLGCLLRERMGAFADLARTLARAGVDLRRDIDRVVITDGLVAMEGRFGSVDPTRIEGVEPEPRGDGWTVADRTTDLPPELAPSAALLAGRWAALTRRPADAAAALDRMSGAVPSGRSPFDPALDAFEIRGIVAGSLLAEFVPGPGMDSRAASVARLQVGVRLGSGMDVRLRVEAADADALDELEAAMRDQLAERAHAPVDPGDALPTLVARDARLLRLSGALELDFRISRDVVDHELEACEQAPPAAG